MAMLVFKFYYFVGGFYDTYLSFEKEVNPDEEQHLFIISECPLGTPIRHFINLSCGSLSSRDSDINIIIKNRIDYCQRFR